MTAITEATYTRAELVEKTGINTHLIHKYIKMGLLPGCTSGANRWCRYDERHVRRLALIQELHNPEKNTLEEVARTLRRHHAFD